MGAASTTAEVVIVRREEGWAAVTLNRPERKNAITAELAEALAAAIEELDDDESVRAILLAGNGGSFCSGMDLDALRSNAGDAPDMRREPSKPWAAVHAPLLARRTPVVVALERFGINAGAALVFSADLVVAGTDSFVQVYEVAMGVAAPMCQVWLQLRHPGGMSRRMVLLGERVPAAELLAAGMVTEVVEPAEVLARATAMCARLASHPAAGLVAVQSTTAWLEHRPADRPGAAAMLSELLAASHPA